MAPVSTELSIVLITYNREAYLQRTLTALSQSALKDCDVWVLNNASTDGTLQVCDRFVGRLPNIHIITHRFNIGGEANVLRAYEYGNHRYKWILCDDDELHLDRVDDLLDALRSQEYDMVRVFGGTPEELGKTSTLGNLLHDPDSFAFYSLGFLPAIIFRQAAVEPCVRFGYAKIDSRYPQLFVMLTAFDMNSSVYTTRAPLLTRGDAPMPSGSEILLAQIQSLAALPTPEARRVAMSWRRKRQKLLGYVFGYGRLILADLRFGRSRRTIAAIWLRTILAVPSLVNKAILAINGVFILAPIRLVYRLVRGKKMESRSYPDR